LANIILKNEVFGGVKGRKTKIFSFFYSLWFL